MENVKSSNVRLQIYVNQDMDDILQDLADVMCISKNEFVKHCLAQAILNYKMGYRVMGESVENVLAQKPLV